MIRILFGSRKKWEEKNNLTFACGNNNVPYTSKFIKTIFNRGHVQKYMYANVKKAFEITMLQS